MPEYKELNAILTAVPAKYADVIRALPTADVKPVVRGKWMMPDAEHTNWHLSKCSNCGRHIKFAEARGFRYCPRCGADMWPDEI